MINKDYFKQTRILDGGMGQELLARGMKPNSTLWSANAILNENYHQLVLDTHIDFIKAGAEIIVTTTFATRYRRLKENNLLDKFEYLNQKAGEIAQLAKKKFPNHQVIGEEFGFKKTKSKYSWIIDPIDGTRSFVIGNPTWSNLISLNFEGKPIIGLANYPVLRKYYFNVSDKIAYVVDQGKKRKIKVNKKVLFKNLKMSAAFHGMLSLNQQKKIPKILKLMQFPCADALSYSHLAEGKVDVVIQCGNKIWDIHPLIPIIEAAGGMVSTWKNTNAVKGGNIVASANKGIQNKILKILKPISK